MVFAATIAAIGSFSARVLASGTCQYACRVSASWIPHNLVMLSERSQYRLVDTLRASGVHAFVKEPPICHANTQPSSRGSTPMDFQS